MHKAFTQRLTFDEFSSDEPSTFAFPNLVYRENVRMVKRRRSARFLFKATQALMVLRKVGGEEFQRHFPVQPGIFGQVYFSHASFAQQ